MKMENQHRQITGYRDLDQEEINKINAIKKLGESVGELVNTMTKYEQAYDQRWINIAKTHLQQGFMALTRAVTKPTSF